MPSISDVRRQMSRERDQELSTTQGVSQSKHDSRGHDRDSLREQKREEERRYRNQGYDFQDRWDDHRPAINFKEQHHFRPPLSRSSEVSLICRKCDCKGMSS